MTSNFKAIGIALVAVLAMSAVAASAAQGAAKITSESGTYPLLLTGEGDENEVFEAFGSEVTCEHSKYTATVKTVEDEEPEESTAPEEVTVSPEYTDCHSVVPFLGKVPATVTTEGCSYVLHGGTEVAADEFTLETNVVCTGGHKIEVHVYLSQSAHEEDSSACTLSVGSQNNKTGLTAVNEGGDVTLEGTVGGLHVEQERNFFLCPAGTTETGGVYNVRPEGVTVTGEAENEDPNPFHLG